MSRPPRAVAVPAGLDQDSLSEWGDANVDEHRLCPHRRQERVDEIIGAHLASPQLRAPVAQAERSAAAASLPALRRSHCRRRRYSQRAASGTTTSDSGQCPLATPIPAATANRSAPPATSARNPRSAAEWGEGGCARTGVFHAV